MPIGKSVKLGVWEDGAFVGVVMFNHGANKHLGTKYGLTMPECCELTRVALTSHKAPVTRIVAVSLRMLKQVCPGIRMVVSYADMRQGHHGGIYQAGNWTYVGAIKTATWVIHGEEVHPRTVGDTYGSLPAMRKADPSAYRIWSVKHKYLMPLDKALRDRVAQLSQPYPKASEAG